MFANAVGVQNTECYHEESEVPLVKSGLPFASPNGEIGEKHIWVWSAIQTGAKMQVTGKILSNKWD